MQPRHWVSFCESVTGTSHKRKGLVNQDCVDSRETGFGLRVYMVAVADGHGSPECSRSDVGARIAVECALDVMTKFFADLEQRNDRLALNKDDFVIERLNRTLKKDVAAEIVAIWQTRVRQHYDANLPETPPAKSNLLLLYGSTLNLTAVTCDLTVSLKIGDGNIVRVYRDGSVEQPLASTVPQVGDETDSLCQPYALDAVRVEASWLSSSESAELAMILVCSDGFSNAFSSSEGFLKAASDISQLVSTADGQASLRKSLAGWLDEYSEYSGDDVTVGILAPGL